MLRLRLVGPFQVERDGAALSGAAIGSRKARTLLKLLAAERARTVRVDRLVEALWPAGPPARAADNVASLVSRLRQALGAGVIEGGRDGYRLGQGPELAVDLDDARRLVAEAERRARAAEPALALVAAGRALALLSPGAVLEDEPDADWAEPARHEAATLLRRARHLVVEAALATGDPAGAAAAAEAASATDRYDEVAARDLMAAYAGAGEPGRALGVYAALAELLADELGADPAPATQALHLAILRDGQGPGGPGGPGGRPAGGSDGGPAPGPDGREPVGLAGRAGELSVLRAAWAGAAGGAGGLVLIAGEAGIGKTTLSAQFAAGVAATGGTIVQARCYEAERSLFLQPFVDALSAAVATMPAAQLRAVVADHAGTLAALVPEVRAVLGQAERSERPTVEMERRRAFEAVTAFVANLAAEAPVLVVLDDLHNAGQSSVALLHYLARQAATSRARVLAVATVRAEEGDEALAALADVAARIDLGPLPADAVAALAALAGRAELADTILRRTGGHALFVVETLRALAAGEEGAPASLQAAVLARVRRAGGAVEETLRAGSVLGASFDLATVGGLLGLAPHVVAQHCDQARHARLLVVSERAYEFANDLVREVLYTTTPAPVRLAHHLRAADLLTNRPESVAAHASAAEDWPRAARAWLLAGEQALRRFAAADAEELLTRALAAAGRGGDGDLRARALVARARAREAEASYAGALVDLEEAAAAAHEGGDQRLEMIALRGLGGDAAVAVGRPGPQWRAQLERCLHLAVTLGDRAMQADTLGRLAVAANNALSLAEAVDFGRAAVEAARASGDPEALAAALDGRKTSLAYLGEIHELAPVLAELEPLLRRLGDRFRLAWAVFESSFASLARADWAGAATTVAAAAEVNQRSGFAAYVPWYEAHLGWLAGLSGRADEAVASGRKALATAAGARHVWIEGVAAALLGTTLLELGRAAEAAEVLEHGRRCAEQDGSEAYLLRCLAPLAEATGSDAAFAEADRLLATITAPPGSAWLYGADAYLRVAAGWLARDEPERARQVLAPMLAAAGRVPWVVPLAAGSLLDGRAAARLGLADEARARLAGAAEVATRHGLARVAAAARAELA